MKAKRPSGAGWRELPVPPAIAAQAIAALRYVHDGWRVSVLSCVEMVHDEPQFHVSLVMLDGSPAPRFAVKAVRKAFGMEAAEEDNHVPGGKVRNLWLLAGDRAGVCECKDEPETVTQIGASVGDEGDAYIVREAPAEP